MRSWLEVPQILMELRLKLFVLKPVCVHSEEEEPKLGMRTSSRESMLFKPRRNLISIIMLDITNK